MDAITIKCFRILLEDIWKESTSVENEVLEDIFCDSIANFRYRFSSVISAIAPIVCAEVSLAKSAFATVPDATDRMSVHGRGDVAVALQLAIHRTKRIKDDMKSCEKTIDELTKRR